MREAEIAHCRVVAEIAQLADAIADSYAENDEARAAKASKRRATLEQGSLREAEERLEGAKRAVAKAEAERGLHAAENVDGLIAERDRDARAAHDEPDPGVPEAARAKITREAA